MSTIPQLPHKEPAWNLYAAALLTLVAFFQVMQWPLSPRFLDIYYHLSVMKGFHDAGGYVMHAFWEYAPGGRPHLYPPFLHIAMLLFYELGLSAIDVGRLVDVSAYPLLLFVTWYVSKKILSDKVAFIALVLLSSVYSVLLAAVTLSAFNLAAVFLLLMVLKIFEKRYFQAGLLLALSFYTHTYMAWLSVLFLFLVALGKAYDKKACLKVALIGILLGLPFTLYQYQSKDYFVLVSKYLKESSLLEIDIALYALTALGLAYCRSKEFLRKAWLPLCLWVSTAPLLATHPVRFVFGHGLLGLILLASLALDKWSAKSTIKLLAVLIFISLASPVFHWNFEKQQGSLRWADRTLVRYLMPDPYLESRTNGFTIYFEEEYDEIKKVIQNNSEKGDILWTDFSYTAGILAILSDRVTSCAMLAEIKPYEASYRIQDAKTIIWFKDKNLKPMVGMEEAVQKYNLKLLKEVEMAFIFDNPNASAKAKVPKPLIPTGFLFGIAGLVLAAAFYRL